MAVAHIYSLIPRNIVTCCKSFHKKVFLVFRMRSFEKLFLFLRYVLFFLEFLINFHFFRFFRSMVTMMCDFFELWEDQPQALVTYFSLIWHLVKIKYHIKPINSISNIVLLLAFQVFLSPLHYIQLHRSWCLSFGSSFKNNT